MSAEKTCPSWCTNQPCSGDHADRKTFVSATAGGMPREVSPESGAVFPVVGVGLDWSESDDWPGPALVLWLTGAEDVEQDVYLRPAEARRVVAELQQRLRVLSEVEAAEARG